MKALENNDFNKEKTSELLQVGLSTLYRKLKELDIKAKLYLFFMIFSQLLK